MRYLKDGMKMLEDIASVRQLDDEVVRRGRRLVEGHQHDGDDSGVARIQERGRG